jgi:PKD repeat protein
MKRFVLAALAALAAAACGKGSIPVADGGTDLAAADTHPPPGDIPVSLAVDFAVENCPLFDPVALTCTGSVPLAIRFVPLATTTVTSCQWDFGDGSARDFETAPSHVYSRPGTYTVKIIATDVGGGLVTKVHTGFIVAQANVLGDPCDSSQQCGQGLFCLCPASAACSTGPSRGMCTSACASRFCGDRQVCANLLTPTPPPATTEPWQTSLCLPECTLDSDCLAGLRCRTLPPGPAGSAWVHGCFAEVPGDVGEPCMDASGNLRDDLCVGGLCANLGAQGMCSMDCARASCPPGSDCVVFGDGRELCLRPCTGSLSFPCDLDPLLECIIPNPGDLGYQLPSNSSSSFASSYCAPKSCLKDEACRPTGTCQAQTGAGHCVRRN